MVQRAARNQHDDRNDRTGRREDDEPRRNGGRLLNRSPALARHRETIQQSRRSSISDWTTSMDAPPSQVDAFDGAIGDLHDAVAIGNHSVWGDPLPQRLQSSPVQMQRSAASSSSASTPSTATSSSATVSAPNLSTPEGGTASDNASYARPAAPTQRRACPEVNTNFQRAVAHANLRNAIDDLLRLPPGGTGDQVAIRDEQGQSRILPRATAQASARRVEAELRSRIGHVEANIIGLRETLRSLRSNNQDSTNPFDFPSAERQVAELERRLTEMRALLASRTADAWCRLPDLLDAAGTSSSQVNAFITENIIDDTVGAEVARTALRTIRNTSLAVFAAAAITATGGLAGVALAGAAGATINVAEQAAEVGNGLRQDISGPEVGAAALYAMLDAAIQALTGTRVASGLAATILQRAEQMLLARGLSQDLARSGARWVAQQALSQVTSRLRQAGDAGVQRATGVARTRPDDTSATSGMTQLVRQPGTALRERGTLPSWTPDAVIAKLDEYGLENQLRSFAQSRVRSLRDQASTRDRVRMESMETKNAVRRAEVGRALGEASPQPSTPVQMRRQRTTETDIHSAAEDGLRGSGGTLPFASRIQQSFGRHDVSSVAAHVDGAAKKANTSMGSLAYATGNSIAFGQSPDLHTAAHEAAHIVQQRSGVQLKGGIGQSGDRYERHADAVAERVVQGRSAEDLLDAYAGNSTSTAVQYRPLQFNGFADDLRQVRDGLRHPIDTVIGHRQWDRDQRDRQAAAGAMDTPATEAPSWFNDLKGAVSTARSTSLSFASAFRGIATDPATATSDALNSEANRLQVVQQALDHPTIRAGLQTYQAVETVSLIARLVHLHDSARDAQARYLDDPSDSNQRAFAVAMTSYINAVGRLAGMVPGMNRMAAGALQALEHVDFLHLSRRVTSMGAAADPYRRGGRLAGEMGDTPLPD